MFYSKLVKDGKIVSVETKSVKSLSPNFKRATKAEYDGYIASRPPRPPPEPPRNLAAEIDGLRARVGKLESE